MRKDSRFLCAYLIFLLLALNFTPARAATIVTITQNNSTIGKFEKFEMTFTLDQTYSNPFDINIIDIMVTIIKPDGNNAVAPAFYYKEYDEDTGGNFVNGRNPCWKVRFAPSQPGIYDVEQIRIIDQNGTYTSDPNITFTCVESGKKGFIRVDNRSTRYMRYDNDETYIPIGHNVCWLNLNGTGQWGDYYEKMSAAGENWTRHWMCPFYQGTILEWTSSWGGYWEGVGKLSMALAWKLDRIIESCEQNDIGMQLVLQYHGQYSSTTDNNWDDNPYNITHASEGGFLTDPNQFFTDSNAIRLTKNKFRYIVARWGYSPAILAWELFNEVQFTDGWSDSQSSVVNWHNTMASYIRSIDPIKHPVTTSSHDPGFENLWNLPDINMIQVHYYGTNTITTLKQSVMNLLSFNKPVFMGEVGIGTENGVDWQPEPQKSQLLEGLDLHNGIWSTCHLRSSGHLWFWNNYIDPYDLYPVFTPLSIYAADENLADYNLAIAQRAVSGAVSIYANPERWEWSFVPQKEFYLQGDCFPGMDKLTQYLQGSWQPPLKSDPNFHLTMPTAGSLKIHVDNVSNSGTNSLAVLVNGVVVFSSGYANGSSNFIITVPLSAGSQTVQVKNTGIDWFHISSYEFAPATAALLNSIGLSNNQRAYIWIYDVNSQYGKINNGTFHNEQLSVKGLNDGSYTVEVYATRGAGGVIASGSANSVSGVLTYTLPDFSKDIAVKVIPPCVVGLDDLAAFCAQWLQSGPNLAGDSTVDFADFNVLAGYWMSPCPLSWPF